MVRIMLVWVEDGMVLWVVLKLVRFVCIVVLWVDDGQLLVGLIHCVSR